MLHELIRPAGEAIESRERKYSLIKTERSEATIIPSTCSRKPMHVVKLSRVPARFQMRRPTARHPKNGSRILWLVYQSGPGVHLGIALHDGSYWQFENGVSKKGGSAISRVPPVFTVECALRGIVFDAALDDYSRGLAETVEYHRRLRLYAAIATGSSDSATATTHAAPSQIFASFGTSVFLSNNAQPTTSAA